MWAYPISMLGYFDLRLKNYGYVLLSVCIILNTIGLVFVNSSTPNNPNNFISQLLSSLLSLFFCVIISVLDIKKVPGSGDFSEKAGVYRVIY